MFRLKHMRILFNEWVNFPKYHRQLSEIKIDSQLEKLKASERYREVKRLLRFGFQVHSQFDDDGIINEIFRRIGVTNRYFVEFGAGAGQISNTCFLLMQKWRGLWLEGDKAKIDCIYKLHKSFIENGSLVVGNAFITAENIESLFRSHGVPEEFDLLSIDIDGNDYHVWKAISTFSPRVVVIEYNARLNASLNFVQDYNAAFSWSGKSYFGAGLKALELLGSRKGYNLVGCNITGANAFFVRKDLMTEENFCAPFTSENHFEPPRYFLGRVVGYRGGNGPHEGSSARMGSR